MTWRICRYCEISWDTSKIGHTPHFHTNGRYSHCYTSMRHYAPADEIRSKWDVRS